MKKDKIYYAQALNEIKILNFLREKDSNNSSNVVKILNYFLFRGHVVKTIRIKIFYIIS